MEEICLWLVHLMRLLGLTVLGLLGPEDFGFVLVAGWLERHSWSSFRWGADSVRYSSLVW